MEGSTSFFCKLLGLIIIGMVSIQMVICDPIPVSSLTSLQGQIRSRSGRIRTESAPSNCDCKKSRAKGGFHESSKYSRQGRTAQFRDSRIIKGVEALPGEFPWQARIEEFNLQGNNEWDHLCGGSLISNRHILTASHCLKTNKENLRVILGVHDRRNKTSFGRFKVVEYITHRPGTVQYDNDIAIMTIEDDNGDGVVCDENIQPICLRFPPSNEDIPSSTSCFISGWGLTESDKTSDVLLYTSIEPQSRKFCQKLYNGPRSLHDIKNDDTFATKMRMSKKISSDLSYQYNYNRFTSGMLCAGPMKSPNLSADSCAGDSGGPFACVDGNHDFFLDGVTSWGIGCGNQPSVYTRISEYKNWIETEMALTGVH